MGLVSHRMAEPGVTAGNAGGGNRSVGKRATHWRAAKVMSWEERALGSRPKSKAAM